MTNHLEKRGTVWYFRRKIPTDLEQHFGRKQIMFSLKTRDYTEAKRLAALHTVLTDAEFAAARTSSQSISTRPDHLDESMADVILHEQEWAQEYEANRAYHDAVAIGEQAAVSDADEKLNRWGLPTLDQMSFLEAYGGFHPNDLPTPEQVARVIGPSPTIRVAGASHHPTNEQEQPAKSLRDVIPSWVRRTSADAGTIKRAEKALELFEDAVGVVALRDLKKAHGAQFVAFLLDEDRPFGAKTAHNHASYIMALLKVAERDDLIDRNPLDLSIDKSIGAKKREPWSDAELT
ncbi:MAG: DUF6538 domain-containing protein [Paraburkholderia tropica]|uniref:DUF6538 domain-containing protein n=1 Tax=Paraburkholderia tropica TaxID=92647 RepID=UPI003100D218